jgi:hypothetical protein
MSTFSNFFVGRIDFAPRQAASPQAINSYCCSGELDVARLPFVISALRSLNCLGERDDDHAGDVFAHKRRNFDSVTARPRQ